MFQLVVYEEQSVSLRKRLNLFPTSKKDIHHEVVFGSTLIRVLGHFIIFNPPTFSPTWNYKVYFKIEA